MAADLIELGRRAPLVGVLGAVRVLPELVAHLLHGERPGEQLALGLVGKLWRPAIEYEDISAEDLRDFAQPGYARTVYQLTARLLDDGTLLSGLMRTATALLELRRGLRGTCPSACPARVGA
jgi:hypothetical protein